MEDRSLYKPVIILGGGITGLAAALFLKQQNVDFVLIEKHPGTSIYPRSRTIDIRAMELFRGLGLSEKLRKAGKHLAPTWGILRGSTLVEALENRLGTVSPTQYSEVQKHMNGMAKASPETACRCTQDISEAIMKNEAESLGLDLRFNHQMLSFQQDAEMVRLLVEDKITKEKYTLTSQYMIAADGANSSVRTQLNISTKGNYTGPDLLNIYFEADLEHWVKDNAFSQFLVDTPEMTGFLLTINNKDKWAFHLRFHPENGETVADYPDNKLKAILHEIIGIPGMEIRIINVLPWKMSVKIADHMRDARVFLAGDAAHTMTPYAGKGANSGIQDAQNLAWKLAAVLNYNSGDALLDTYDAERRPVGAFYANLSGEIADTNGLVNDSLLVTKAKILMGLPIYAYPSGSENFAIDLSADKFNGKPGTRMPHLWLDDEHHKSSLDLIEGSFTLIATKASYWRAAILEIHRKLNIDVQLKIIDDIRVSKKWKDIVSITNRQALLIRPDDFVVGKVTPEELLDQLASVLLIENHPN